MTLNIVESDTPSHSSFCGPMEQLKDPGTWDDDLLAVTERILSVNPDYYSVWNFRKRFILQTTKSMDDNKVIHGMYAKDIHFTTACLKRQPKSYWVWHHRKWCLQNMPEPTWEHELKLLDKMLDMDARNFHGWDYRRYVIEQSKVRTPRQEYSYTTQKIEQNFSNFSAWHYRGLCLMRGFIDEELQAHIQSDLELVRNAVYTEPNDSSAWLYQQFLLGSDGPKGLPKQPQSVWMEELKYIEELVEMEPECKAALLGLMHVLEHCPGISDHTELHERFSKRRKEVCDTLMMIDPLRKSLYDEIHCNLQ